MYHFGIMGPAICDYNKRLILLSVIHLSGGHSICILRKEIFSEQLTLNITESIVCCWTIRENGSEDCHADENGGNLRRCRQPRNWDTEKKFQKDNLKVLIVNDIRQQSVNEKVRKVPSQSNWQISRLIGSLSLWLISALQFIVCHR